MLELRRMKVLHVCFDFPWPPAHGGRVDMWARIVALKQLGCEVDLVCTVKTTPTQADMEYVRGYVRNLTIVPRLPNWRGIFCFRPGQHATRAPLASLPLSESYDVLLMECENTAAILDNPTLRAGRTILRVHNDEGEYMRQMGRSSGPWLAKLYFWQESSRYRKFSKELFERVDNLWFISDDFLAVQPKEIRRKSVWVPGGIDSMPAGSSLPDSHQVLFVGTLTIPTNQEAIRWYLTHIHYRLLDIPGYVFQIAGSTRGQDLHDFMYFALGHAAVRIQTDAEDLAPIYQASRVFVNPMQSGNSVKIKTLNAAQSGIPVVTTTVGNEGTGLKHGTHVLVADDVQQFADAVRYCLLGQTAFAEKAREFIASRYNHAENIERALAFQI